MFQLDGTREARIYSSRLFDVYLKYIDKKYPDIDSGHLLEAAGIERYEIIDPDHWFTQKQFDAFYEKGVELTGDAQLARESGRYLASGDGFGFLKRWSLGLLTPSAMCSFVEKAGNFFSRSLEYQSKKIGKNSVEVRVKEKTGACESRHQCEQRIGFFEAAIRMCNNQLVRIEHPECLFRNGDVCRYLITWKKPFYLRLKQVSRYAVLAAPIISILLSFVFPFSTVALIFLLSLLVILPAELTALFLENRELHSRLADLKDTTDELFEQSEINYNNSLMTYEIGAAITKQTSNDNVLNKFVEILNFRLNFDRGMILLAGGNGDGPRLEYIDGFGYSEEQYGMLQRASFRLDNPDSKGVFVVSYRKQKPFLINDVNNIEDDLSSRSLKIARMLGTRSFICCPILYERRSLGVLAVDNIQSKKPLAERDKNLLMGFAHMIGISLNNAELIEIKEKQFKSLLQTLAASIDARDPLTAGHSQQVTEYA
ncbi:MAG: GAF domain-containing protein, partial [Desulfohalobiaceae bacterium]|nr:GAF domain-containing protein [Desulfohalobiaceae bacterium]